MNSERLGFGKFEVDLAQRTLRRDGQAVPLQPRTFDLLAYLAHHPGETLDRRRLLEAVWGAVHVSDGALSSAIYQVRKALGDTEREPPWVCTVRGEGFRFEAPVRKLAPQAVPPPYFGRPGLLRELIAARDEACGGHGQLLLLEGDAGMGKTRTSEELVRSAKGVQLARGWCEANGAAPAFWPWTQVLRQLAPAEIPGGASEALGLRPGSRPPQELSWDEPIAGSRVEVLDGLASALRSACERSPIAVVLEDLHDADGPSLGALEYVARRMADWPLLVMATYRPGQLESLGDAIGGVVSLSHVRRFELKPLDAPSVMALASHILGRAATQRVCKAIFERSGGNPFFAWALAREVALGEATDAELPRSIRAVLARRLDRLRPATRKAVRIAAVAGHRFDVDLVDALAEQAVPDWQDEALAAGIVELDASAGPWRFRFGHALLREAAESELAPGERARLHQRIAERKLTPAARPSGPELAEIAHHLAAALPIAKDGGADALRFCRAAAEEALRASAWESCEGHATVALGILESPSRPEDPQALLGVMALRCVALNSQGGRSEEVGRSLDEADVLLERVQNAELRAVFAGLRCVHEGNLGHYGRAMGSIEDLPEELVGSADLGRLWRGTFHAVGGAFGAARDAIDEEPPPAETRPAFVHYLVQDPSVVALASSAIASFALGDERGALRRVNRATRLAEEERAPYSLAMARFLACMLHDLRGDPRGLAEAAAPLDALATDHGIAPFLGSGFMFGAWADELLGQPRLRIASLGAVVAPRFERPEGGGYRGYSQNLVARFFERAGRFDEAQKHALAVRDWSEQHGERWVLCETWRLLGRLARVGGRLPEARDAWTASRDLARSQGSPVYELRALCELHALDADPAAAREIERILSEPRELPARDRALAQHQLA